MPLRCLPSSSFRFAASCLAGGPLRANSSSLADRPEAIPWAAGGPAGSTYMPTCPHLHRFRASSPRSHGGPLEYISSLCFMLLFAYLRLTPNRHAGARSGRISLCPWMEQGRPPRPHGGPLAASACPRLLRFRASILRPYGGPLEHTPSLSFFLALLGLGHIATRGPAWGE